MGIQHLDTFIHEQVLNGCSRVNIKHEIDEYYRAASRSTLPAPPPVIVIDLRALRCTLTSLDMKSLLFGARFNVGFHEIDRFFAKLKGLRVELQFFMDGTVPSSKLPTWCKRRDIEYQQLIEVINAVDQGTNIETILDQFGAPGCSYAVKFLARKYGRVTISMGKECDQELVAFAFKTKALAIISNNTDFLVMEGSWRYWSCSEINIHTLETLEYNRQALLEHLGLNMEQMPMYATLCGNGFVKLEQVQPFHYRIGLYDERFINLAKYVRKHRKDLDNTEDQERMLKFIFGPGFKKVEVSFRQSLNFYEPFQNYTATVQTLTNDPTLAVIMEQSNPFMYQVWHNQPYTVLLGLVDMRSPDLGWQLPGLVLRILLRTAGVIVFHQVERGNSYKCQLVIKLDHESNYTQHDFPVEFPTFMSPPTLMNLFSTHPITMCNLMETKLRLLSWIISDTLDYQLVGQFGLRPLLATALTLYLLVEQRILQLFEADLILQVAHDVVTQAYDPGVLEYPNQVGSRPFRLVFFYKKVYQYVSKAIDSVAMNPYGFRDDPPFDGVLFHSRYEQWANGGGDLTQIKQWRIYAEQE